MKHPVDLILVPQGAEYQAVCRGLKNATVKPVVLPTPAGAAVSDYLKKLEQEGLFADRPSTLMMGLCGGLSDRYKVGEVVLYQECLSLSTSLPGKELEVTNTATTDSSDTHPPIFCDRSLTAQLSQLIENATLVRALTSDRVICTAVEKRSLAKYADVVDMESYFALELFSQSNIPVAILRVVSDGCDRNIPDLSKAFNSDGSLQILPTAIGMIRQPIAALHLIQGSLKGLKVMERIVSRLFN